MDESYHFKTEGKIFKDELQKTPEFPIFWDPGWHVESTCEVNSRTSRTFPAVYLGSLKTPNTKANMMHGQNEVGMILLNVVT